MSDKLTYNAIIKEFKTSPGIVGVNSTANFCIYFTKHHWDGGYDSFNGYQGAREEYYDDQKQMFDFLYDFLDCLSIKKCIVAPVHYDTYFHEWSDLKENDIYIELMKILKKHKIRKNSKSGLEVDIKEDFWILKRFIEGGFRFISYASLLFPFIQTAIVPSHHFDFFVYTARFEDIFDPLRQLLTKYPNIKI